MLDIFLQKNIESGLKDNKNRKRTFLNFEKIKKVLILFDINDWDSISPIYDDLKQNGKQVIAWTILPKLEKGQTHSIKYPEYIKILDLQKDVDWKRVFRSEVFIEFDKLEYDTLIDLSFESNDYMMSLKVRNKSSFYISFSKIEHKIFDFVIFKEEDKSLWETYEQMKIYLDHIQ